MNSIYLNNIIFGKTLESANRKLDTIVNSIPYGDVKEVRKSKYDYSVELKDGTRYMIASASQSSKGYRCDKVYIECGIDQEIIDCVIEPMLIVSKLDNDKQVEYF